MMKFHFINCSVQQSLKFNEVIIVFVIVNWLPWFFAKASVHVLLNFFFGL